MKKARKLFHVMVALAGITVLVLTFVIHGKFETPKDKLNIILRPLVIGLIFYQNLQAYRKNK